MRLARRISLYVISSKEAVGYPPTHPSFLQGPILHMPISAKAIVMSNPTNIQRQQSGSLPMNRIPFGHRNSPSSSCCSIGTSVHPIRYGPLALSMIPKNGPRAASNRNNSEVFRGLHYKSPVKRLGTLGLVFSPMQKRN
jgi:hypothetical protein